MAEDLTSDDRAQLQEDMDTVDQKFARELAIYFSAKLK